MNAQVNWKYPMLACGGLWCRGMRWAGNLVCSGRAAVRTVPVHPDGLGVLGRSGSRSECTPCMRLTRYLLSIGTYGNPVAWESQVGRLCAFDRRPSQHLLNGIRGRSWLIPYESHNHMLLVPVRLKA